MKRGACAPLFIFYILQKKSFGFSLGFKQLHNNTTIYPLFNQRTGFL